MNGRGSVVLSCKCKSSFQDQRYGTDKRLHNYIRKKQSSDQEQARCTSCGNVRKA